MYEASLMKGRQLKLMATGIGSTCASPDRFRQTGTAGLISSKAKASSSRPAQPRLYCIAVVPQICSWHVVNTIKRRLHIANDQTAAKDEKNTGLITIQPDLNAKRCSDWHTTA